MVVDHKHFPLYDGVIVMSGGVLIKRSSRVKSGIEISRAKCLRGGVIINGMKKR